MKIDRVGEVSYNNFGNKMVIKEYTNSVNIVVNFEEFGYLKKTRYHDFKTGRVKCPYDKNYSGLGYIGVGKYSITDSDGNKTKIYRTWQNIIDRCYKDRKSSRDYYKNSIVCDEWHNFQNFAKWCEENYYEVDEEEMQLDKDIVQKGNKIYSPETCVFVPKRINTLLINNKRSRGEYPIGVCWNKRDEVFCVHCSIIENGRKINKFIGNYSDSDSAFNRYKEFKESYIRNVADNYADKIPKRVYNALINYRIEKED